MACLLVAGFDTGQDNLGVINHFRPLFLPFLPFSSLFSFFLPLLPSSFSFFLFSPFSPLPSVCLPPTLAQLVELQPRTLKAVGTRPT